MYFYVVNRMNKSSCKNVWILHGFYYIIIHKIWRSCSRTSRNSGNLAYENHLVYTQAVGDHAGGREWSQIAHCGAMQSSQWDVLN